MRRDIFRAIADPTRRALVMLLAVQSMTPNAMAEHFATSRQAVSKHIQVLMECELLTQDAQGREIQYSLKTDRMQEVEQWLAQFKALMAQRFTQLDEVLARIQATRQAARQGENMKAALAEKIKAATRTSPKVSGKASKGRAKAHTKADIKANTQVALTTRLQSTPRTRIQTPAKTPSPNKPKARNA